MHSYLYTKDVGIGLLLGSGAYSNVIKAYDKQKSKYVIIK